MPRVKIGVPEAQLAIERELRERYGGAMSTRQIGIEVGLKDTAARTWCESAKIPYVQVGNSKRRYRISDVAKAIYQNTYF